MQKGVERVLHDCGQTRVTETMQRCSKVVAPHTIIPWMIAHERRINMVESKLKRTNALVIGLLQQPKQKPTYRYNHLLDGRAKSIRSQNLPIDNPQ